LLADALKAFSIRLCVNVCVSLMLLVCVCARVGVCAYAIKTCETVHSFENNYVLSDFKKCVVDMLYEGLLCTVTRYLQYFNIIWKWLLLL